MSDRTKFWLPIIAMGMVLCYAAIQVVVSHGDERKMPLPGNLGDMTQARRVEIHDAAGQVVLSGELHTVSDKRGEIERKAALIGSGSARGEAEIEIRTRAGGNATHELEISVEGLAANTAYKAFIDEQEIASFTTDARGEAEIGMEAAPVK